MSLEQQMFEFAQVENLAYTNMLRDRLGKIGIGIDELPLRQIDFIAQNENSLS